MQRSRQVPSQVLEVLEKGGLILCGNARSVHALHAAYGSEQLASAGHTTWRTPMILDWHAWLQSQWEQLLMEGSEHRLMLSTFQEELVWTEILRPSLQNRSLIAPADVAPMARAAYALLGSHNALSSLRRSNWDTSVQEPELFRNWAMEMERRCERNGWLSGAHLPQVVMTALRDRRLPQPPAMLWNGFDRLTPAQAGMRSVLLERGTEISDLSWDLKADQALFVARTSTEEIEVCATWASALLRENPEQKIAVLVPDVPGSRAAIDRVFRRVFFPEGILFPSLTQTPAYEFTLGMPLSEVPVVHAAIEFLRWWIRPAEQESITYLLTSGFFCVPEDVAALAAADIALRQAVSTSEMTLEEHLEHFQQLSGYPPGGWAVGNWVRRVQRARVVLEGRTQARQGRMAYAQQWVSSVINMLDAAGWPGQRHVDSVGFQVLDRWNRALEEVSTASFHERRYDFAAFVEILLSHLDSVIFAPRSQGSQITISGLPESAGQRFDAIWVLGMADQAWPPRSNPHPFLPLSLQKELGMPGSDPAVDQLFEKSVIRRLTVSTSRLNFSYAKEGSTGARRPSYVLAALPSLSIPPSSTEVKEDSLQDFNDEMSVPWPGGYVKGGLTVLKDQSACPFRAFASRRFGARELPSSKPGLSPVERGSILHCALEKIWDKGGIQDSEQLRFLVHSGGLAEVVRTHVADAFRRFEEQASSSWEREYLRLEAERVASLVEEWLLYENRRRPFRVQHVEAKTTLQFGNLELAVRMDRVDAIEDGSLLIDYKTGPVHRRMWEGTRPDEPQLPAYAVFGGVQDLHDVLFAHVAEDDVKFISAAFPKQPDIFPAKPGAQSQSLPSDEAFHAILESWEWTIRELAHEFDSGIATVSPKDYPDTCKFCAFPGLCRIAELNSSPIAHKDTMR